MAARFFINGGTDNNWGTANNWSATSGGAPSGVAPIATDDVHLDANSPNCIVNASARACLTFDCTGYVNTLQMDQQLTANSHTTLSAAMTITGTALLAIAGAATTMTSNGKAWPNNLNISGGTANYTVADDWNVAGLVSVPGSTATTVVNGNQIFCGAGFNFAGTTANLFGTTVFVITGTGTVTGPSIGVMRCPLTINAPGGTVTFQTGAWRYNTGTLTYVAGTVVASNTDLISILGTTFNTGGSAMVFRSITLAGTTQTYTFNSSLYVVDLLPQGNTNTITTLNGASADIRVSGNLTITSTNTGSYTGTLRSVIMAGTGTMSWASFISTGRWGLPLIFDAGAGTVTVSGTFPIDLSKLVYLSGTVVTSATWTTGGVTPTYPPASKVYAGTDRGDGVIGTLHASNIATAAGAGSNLAAGDLRLSVTVDDVTGTLNPTGGGGGAGGSSDRINVGGGF